MAPEINTRNVSNQTDTEGDIVRQLDVETADKQRRALRLRNLGASYDQIADELGYAGRSGAWKAVKAALDRAVIEPAMEQRVIQSERLDLMVMRCLGAVLNGDLEQVRNVLAIEKRRADLWGLDAPKNVEVLGAFANVGGDTNVAGLLLERLQTLASLSTPPIDSNVIEVEQS